VRRFAGGFGAVLLLAFAVVFLGSAETVAQTTSYIDLDQYKEYDDFAAGTKNRVKLTKLANGDGWVSLGNPRSATDTTGSYNGGRYYWGTLTSPVYETSTRFDTLVPSWNASTPAGTWMELEVRVRSSGNWSRWFNMGVWAKGTTDIKRHSVNAQSWGAWAVYTDTLQSSGPVFANAYRYRLKLMASKPTLSPTVRKVSAVSSDSYRHGDSLGVAALERAWGRNLAVPARSQMVYEEGGEVWCSPTSLSMVMAYWSNTIGKKRWNQTVPTVVRGTYDHVYRGWGNWPVNTAYASHFGLEATVSRFGQIEQVERWIDAGIPVIASIAWDNRVSSKQLTGAPLTSSDGHLLVIRGFTSSGDVIVNDPAASSDSGVPRVYDRQEFSRAWLQTGSGGVVYLVHPGGWRTSYPYAARGSS
jgi:Peptidase_C39 like family